MEKNTILEKDNIANFNKLDNSKDLDILLDRVGDSQFVLLGEASHGTYEFYRWRIEITKRLIKEKGFSFIAVEGDWPNCFKVNRYIKGLPDSEDNKNTAYDILYTFNRWPTWMWANKEIVELVEWLKSFNDEKKQKQQQHQHQQDKNKKIIAILISFPQRNLLDFMVLISIVYGNPWKQLYNI